MACYNIMAVLLEKRIEGAVDVQNVFTKYGCIVKVRLGLHETSNVCSNEGLIILQLDGDKKEIQAFEDQLTSIEGVKVKVMEICS